ncbi:MAG: hypothetical protein FJW61_06485 [Actinobacteria bacterium]|jgi:hypothetical protein|nr:hypothetical protein [Actinomycetota bacterium]
MYKDEIIEIVSVNKNKELSDWYNSNIKNLAKILIKKLETKKILKVEPENYMLDISVEIPEKVVS